MQTKREHLASHLQGARTNPKRLRSQVEETVLLMIFGAGCGMRASRCLLYGLPVFRRVAKEVSWRYVARV